MTVERTFEGQCPPTDRRTLLIGGAAAVALSAFLARLPVASAQEVSNGWREAVETLLGESTPVESQLSLNLPEIAENGNTVPFAVDVESPMTAEDYTKTITVFSTSNPLPTIIALHFTPLSGKASAVGRMRLAKSQDIVAVAELSNGTFLMARRSVHVTIGGCGG